jgi:Na+-driven multidrug efflux pump
MHLENACRLQIKKLRFHKRALLEILRIGLPAGVQSALFSISNVIIQSTVNSFGTVAMAGIAAGSNVDGYIFTCTNAIAQTAMNFTSQNIGAQKYENVPKMYRYCLSTAFIAAATLSAIAFVFRTPIVSMFSNEAAVVAIGADRLTLILPFYFFCSLMDVTAGQVRGMGRSIEPMIISLLGACGSRLLWVFLILPLNRTLMMLYWSYPVSWALTFFAQTAFYFYAAHKLKKKGLALSESNQQPA